MTRKSLFGAVAVLAALAGCCPRPIRESVEWSFAADGSVEVRTTTRVDDSGTCSGRPGRAERVEAARAALLARDDLWAVPMKAAAPVKESVALDFDEGRLVGFRRVASFPNPRSLGELFAPFGIATTVETVDGVTTLELVPGRPLAASSREAKVAGEALDRFAAAARTALLAAARVSKDVAGDPDRARAAWHSFFAPVLGDAERGRGDEGTGEPPEQDRAALEALAESVEALMEALAAEGEPGYTLDETVERVHDPFPARLAVRLPAPPDEVVGFAAAGDGRWEVPERTLGASLVSLEGEWLSPDPVALFLRAALADEARPAPVDLEAFLRAPVRVGEIPTAGDLRRALAVRLSPEGLLRLRWRPARGAVTPQR